MESAPEISVPFKLRCYHTTLRIECMVLERNTSLEPGSPLARVILILLLRVRVGLGLKKYPAIIDRAALETHLSTDQVKVSIIL